MPKEITYRDRCSGPIRPSDRPNAPVAGDGVVFRQARDEPGRCRNTLAIEVEDVGKLAGAVRGIRYHLVVACRDRVSATCDQAAEAGMEVLRA